MHLIIGRRAVLATGLALSALPSSPSTDVLTLTQALNLVLASCDPAYLSAVRSTGRFLYRGESSLRSTEPARVFSPPPDLLDLETYGDAEAVRYFRALEQRLATAKVAPSSGHIAVADAAAAGAWGSAASIWPLGTLHYVWPRDRDAFWPRDAEAGVAIRDEALCIDTDLSGALRLGREVLFASSTSASAYVAIDASADGEVRRRLRLGRERPSREARS